MKKHLFIAVLCILLIRLQAQNCQVQVPNYALAYCDSNFTVNSIYYKTIWMINDGSIINFNGNNNTVFFSGSNNNTVLATGNYNTIFIPSQHPVVHIVGNGNSVYTSGFADIEITGDSNLLICQNANVIFHGNSNLLNANTPTVADFGLNNITTTTTNCSGLEVLPMAVSPTPCNQTTGLGEENVDISVFPNPATEVVTFNLQNAGTVRTITLYDIAGKTVEVLANITTDKVTFNTAALGSGLYVYSITLANGKTQHGKLLIRS